MNSAMRNLGCAALALLALCMPQVANAQFEERIAKSDYNIDPEAEGQLSLEIDNVSFFKDNEFDGTTMVSGYTLPGLWLQPKLTYNPLQNIHLELGAHALVYDGAYKFPSYAYDDIAEWKGSQYQKGAHLLPYFRAQVALKHVNLVLGDIYGGSNHNLITPLYNPELNLTADPEVGFQLLCDLPKWHFDAWINWQSFIFEKDYHQEAFTVGFVSHVRLNSESALWHAYIPTQITIQHRGGQNLAERNEDVQTLTNGAVGLGVDWNVNRRLLKQVNVEVDGVGSYQQAGEMWPMKSGAELYAKAALSFGNLNVSGAYSYNSDFISLFGSPFFGAVSTKEDDTTYKNPQTFLLTLDYSRSFGKHYAIGAKADMYYSMACDMTGADGVTSRLAGTANFDFGVYFRINPSFVLKRFKK